MYPTPSFCLKILFPCIVILGSAIGEPRLRLEVHANLDDFPAGTPIALVLSLKNEGDTVYTIPGRLGLRTGVAIQIRQGEDKPSFFDPPILHGDTMGGVPIYTPSYYFAGSLKPGHTQKILYMVSTTGLRIGQWTVRGMLFSTDGKLISSPAGFKVLKNGEQDEDRALSDKERGYVFRRVVILHNYYPRLRTDDRIRRIALEALGLEKSTIGLEYTFYCAVLQGFGRDATFTDLDICERAGRAFLDRFPNSVLRAQVHMVLFEVSLKKALLFGKEGAAIPEATPLFNLYDVDSRLKVIQDWSRRR